MPLYIVNLCGVWLLFTMLRCRDRWASPLMSFSCSSVTAPVLLQLLETRQLCLKTEIIQILFSFNILKIICRKPLYFPSNFPFIQKLFTGNKIYPKYLAIQSKTTAWKHKMVKITFSVIELKSNGCWWWVVSAFWRVRNFESLIHFTCSEPGQGLITPLQDFQWFCCPKHIIQKGIPGNLH